MSEDLQLLRRYAARGPDAEAAFAALVHRHVDLVYAVARRTVGSPAQAEEVTQSVFLDLARQAGGLSPETPLVAWLHLVSRRTAVDAVRREKRRQARETAAAELAAGDERNESRAGWSAIEPLLDEAVESLPPADRTAILLRFFQNKSLREVGAALGTSDDAAQKRVSRALENLRTFLTRRGITVTAAGLAADLSAAALPTAPVALASGIAASVAATTATIGQAVAGAASATAAGLLPNSLAALAAAGVLGVAAYESNLWQLREAELDVTRRELAVRTAELHRLGTEQEAVATALRQARDRQATLTRLTGDDPAVAAAIEAWLQRRERLRQVVATRPEFDLPELAVLTEDDWFEAARELAHDDEAKLAEAMRTLQTKARNTLAGQVGRTLMRHVDAHGGALPATLADLARAAERGLTAELLGLFELRRQGSLHAFAADDWLLAEPVARAHRLGSRMYVARRGAGTEDLSEISDAEMRRAVRAFAAAHDGRLPVAAADLLDHLTTPPLPATREALLAKPAADFRPERLRPLLSGP
ncbi:MAG: sigma-70 family RNA polymerase sigma factor [Verrucomicrobia bacterium]|nr:sigma-70 family RNA polymerase sigma factor [Verrucomicrobiota bacterium]